MRSNMKYSWFIFALFITACNSSSDTTTQEAISERPKANITEVTAQGSEGNFTFYVTVASDETGCDQYADWWEVLNANGELVYRRVLLHSHPTDQPFTRSGSPVNIESDATVYIRAHMNNDGYTGDVFKGSVTNGFLKIDTPPVFSDSIDEQQPLPNDCAF